MKCTSHSGDPPFLRAGNLHISPELPWTIHMCSPWKSDPICSTTWDHANRAALFCGKSSNLQIFTPLGVYLGLKIGSFTIGHHFHCWDCHFWTNPNASWKDWYNRIYSHIDIWFMIGYPFLLVKYSRSEQKNADISTAFPHHLTHVNNPPPRI